MNRSLVIVGLSCACFVLAVAGCQQHEPPPPAAELTVIPVSHPVQRQVTDYVYYTGRLDAVQSLDVRPRVTGYLTKMPFKEGLEVKTGDLLFEVDPRPYQAQYDASKAQVELYESAYKLAHVENLRSKAIAQRAAASISQEELEKSQTQEAQALAQLNLAKASLSLADLNLGFTRITAQIDGHISRYFYTIGNLVTQDVTLLTTIVTVDPMYVFFDMDELTVQRIRKALIEGKLAAVRETSDIRVNIGLESEQGYPHEGHLNFVNNTVNQSTGTITVRGVVPNPQPPRGRRLFTPRMFVRVQLPIGQPHDAVLVIDRAIGTDQGVKYVYVLDAEHKVQYRRVTPGPLEDDGLRVVEEGLKPDDWVVIGALQQVRPRMQVEPEETPMLTPSGAADSTESSSVPARPNSSTGEPQKKAVAPPPPATRPSAPPDRSKRPSSPPEASKR